MICLLKLCEVWLETVWFKRSLRKAQCTTQETVQSSIQTRQCFLSYCIRLELLKQSIIRNLSLKNWDNNWKEENERKYLLTPLLNLSLQFVAMHGNKHFVFHFCLQLQYVVESKKWKYYDNFHLKTLILALLITVTSSFFLGSYGYNDQKCLIN